MSTRIPELGRYGLASHTDQPAELLDEVRLAEELGLGSVFLSERFNLKDAGVLAGAAAAVTTRLGIATAATNHNTRHPLVTATMAAPTELEPVVAAWRDVRPGGLDALPANPGRMS